MSEFTPVELMAVIASQQLEDGKIVGIMDHTGYGF